MRRTRNAGRTVLLPTLEDSVSIQVALSDVIGALAAGRINAKSAGTLLYGLSIAGTNIRKTLLHSTPGNLVIESETDPQMGEVAPARISREFQLEDEKKARRK